MTGTASTSDGALPETAAVVTRIAGRADQVAARAASLAAGMDGDAHTLLTALGGGPPAQLKEAGALASDAVSALAEAVAALRDANAALTAFAAGAV